MQTRFIAKDSGSGDGGCPASYHTDWAPQQHQGHDTQGIIIQGIKIPLTDLQEVAEHESAVWVPANVIRSAAAELDRLGVPA